MVRQKVCEGLKWLNIEFDQKLNSSPSSKAFQISTPQSQTSVWVIPTNEEIIIARDVFKLTTQSS